MPMWTSRTLVAFLSLEIALNLIACGSDSSGSRTHEPACQPAQKFCDADAGTRSCTNVLTDNANCGACGKACDPGTTCAAGVCTVTSCAADQSLCSAGSNADASAAYCASLLTDNANCGACGKACDPGAVCANGRCAVTTCPAGQTLCGADAGATAYCANLLIDNANCGCCGNACSPSQACRSGRCDTTASYGFFLLGDMQAGPAAGSSLAQVAMSQINAIDANAVAVFSNGDLIETAAESQWAQHDMVVAVPGSNFAGTCPASFGANRRYFATVGDHEIANAAWLDLWNQHLPAQKVLGQNSEDGVYYSVVFANALFVMLDSEHVSPEQTSWLESTLTATNAQLRFLFFHAPVYPCVSRHPPLSAALPWVDLAERHGVNVVFSSHTHVYTRSCPRKAGACTADGTGVVYVETGPLSAEPRHLDVTTSSVTGTDAAGNLRTDSYNCQSDLMASGGSQNDFCHVRVDGCQATVECYLVAAGNTVPYDTWTVNGCR